MFKGILKSLAFSLIENVIIAFRNLAILRINQNQSLDQLTKEKFIAALHSIDLKDFIKNC